MAAPRRSHAGRRARSDTAKPAAAMPDRLLSVATLDAAGQITFAEGRAFARDGRPGAEAMGRPAAEVWREWPELLAVVHAAIRGEPARATLVLGTRRIDGRCVPITGTDDAVAGATLVLLDITEYQRTTAALSESESRFRRIAETTSVGVMVSTMRRGVEWVNDALLGMLGLTRAEFVPGQFRLADFTPPEWMAVTEEMWDSLRKDGYHPPYEKEYQRHDGTRVPVLISAAPMLDGADTVVAFIFDLTERKAAEAAERRRQAAEEANRAKSEFLSRMSHELRTPLNSISGFAQLLALDELTSQQQRNIQHIQTSSRHLLNLINEVLDIARIDAGNLALSPEPVELRAALREAVDLMRPQATTKDIALSLSPHPGPPPWVRADRQRLTQVLLNLLSNAIKYNQPGGSVTVSSTAYDDGGRVGIEVSDSGWGMTPDQQQRLFVPFDRLGVEMRGVEGTGLGLALSRRLIEAMAGTISVASTAGAGSTFLVELPAATAPAVSAPSLPVAAMAAAGPIQPRVILTIEDNLANLTLIEQVLERWPGADVLPAMTGRLGIELAREQRPDLILLDLHLPDLNGDRVLAELKADRRTARIPVVIISADATAGQIDRLRAAGADAYFTKPLDILQFLQYLQRLWPRG